MRDRLRTLLPGQFGIQALFVLITLAAFAFAIGRLPIHAIGKIALLVALWFGFRAWAGRRSDSEAAESPEYVCRLAVLRAVGSVVLISAVFYFHSQISTLTTRNIVMGACVLVALVAQSTFHVIKTIRAERART